MKNFLSAEDSVERMKTQAKMAGSNYKPPRLVPRTYKELSTQMIQLGNGHKAWAGCSPRGYAGGRHTQESCSTALPVRETLIEIMMQYHRRPIVQLNWKHGHKPNALKVVETLDLSRLLVERKTVQPFWNRARQRFLIELDLCIWDALVTALLGVCPRDMKTVFTQNPARGCS